MDQVFRALADETRRDLLDRLFARGGQTLGELCDPYAKKMSRQAVMKHLAILEEAGLLSTMREGREKRHYLNPLPIQAIQERWIRKFEKKRLEALSLLKAALEEQEKKGK